MILRVSWNFAFTERFSFSVLFTVITFSSFYLSETLVLENHACYFGSRLVSLYFPVLLTSIA